MLTNQSINVNNLLRFKPVTTPTVDSTYTSTLHSGNRLWRRNILNPLPAIKGDVYTFYTNFTEDTGFVASDFAVAWDDNCNYTLLNDLTEPSFDAQAFGANNFKITISILDTSTENKFLRVVRRSGSTITHVSNPFLILPRTEQYINNSHLFEFYHNSDIYGYEWATFDIETDTPYTIRIPSTVKSVEYPRDVSTYEAATTGVSRNTRAINRKDYSFQIYFRTDEDHDAIATLINFKNLEINGRPYLPLESYEIEYNDSFNIYVGTIKLRDINYSVRINRCTT